MLIDPAHDFFAVAGVDHKTITRCIDAIDQDVVQNAACFVADQTIADLSIDKVVDSAGQQAAEQWLRCVASERQAAHVRDIKQANRRSDGVVFVDDARVLHGHFPAAEFHHPSAVSDVPIKQGRTVQCHSSFFRQARSICCHGGFTATSPRSTLLVFTAGQAATDHRSMTLGNPFGKIRRDVSMMLPRTTGILVGLFAAFVFAATCKPLQADDSKPNVILFLVDDLGWADLGCYGSKFHKTPNLDRLASEGMRFTQAYAAAPIGLPTRASIITGRSPQRLNMTASYAVDAEEPRRRLKRPEVSRQLPLSEVTIAEALKAAGYATGCIGKWHMGGRGYGPREQGFDVSIAGEATGTKYNDFAPYADADGNLIPGLEQAPAGEYLTDRLAAETVKFIGEHKTQPFFLFVPQFATHMPSTPKPEIAAKYGPMPGEPRGGQINPDFAAILESLDDAIGRVMKALDDQQLSQKTLILFTTDNGGVCNGNGQIIASTSNAPLRDGMGHLYEGGLRVPLIAKWAGVIKAGSVSDEIVSCLDFFPTIVEACAASARPKDAPSLDGVSLLPVLKGTGKLARDFLCWHYPHYNVNAGSIPGGAIRSGDWKLVEFYETGRRELFNVGKELSESNNLIEQQAEVARELGRKLEEWRQSVGAKMPSANPNYAPNPQADDGTVMMHASTADVFGLMLRYEPLPHKDTLGYWVRQEDWARFEFTLKKPGRYHLVPHVGCGTSGGSLVHFEVANQVLPLKVPGTGQFQNFVPQDLGIVTLDKPGRYTLTVKPQQKEGVAVMDIRRIELRPVAVAEMLPELHLLDPFWRSATVYRESVLFVQDGERQAATGKLLFPSAKILEVRSADGLRKFQEGTDYVSDGRQLKRADSSSIPFLKSSDLFMPKGSRPVWRGGAQPAVPCALPHKVGDPETHLLFDNGHWFHDQQVEVSYERADQGWDGPVPQFDSSRLPKTVARLKAKQKLTICMSGDSITYGLNASGLVGAAPYMPMYPDLVAGQLRLTYGADVSLFNRAVGGWRVPNGLSDLDKLLEHQPDLVVIAYGMNDVGSRNPEGYRDGIGQMIARIKGARPDAEVILVATMLGNDQWTHTPRDMFPKYRDALKSLCTEGIAMADLTSLWTEMLRRKRDCDLTGNGVNHPSDFGHRVYASAILSLLVEPNSQ